MHKQKGFTIVELLIVIVVIAILAAISIVAYNGIQNRSKIAKRDSDISLYYKAILAARINSGKTLYGITGSPWSIGRCAGGTGGGNQSNTEPKSLLKTHDCWMQYYDNLNKIGAAAGMDLSSLRAGDSNGNPYGIDENEGEYCGMDVMYYFNGTGDNAYTVAKYVPLSTNC